MSSAPTLAPTSAVAPTFAPPPRPDGQINNLGNIQTTMNDAAPTPAPTSAPVRRQRVLPRNYLKVVSLFDGISCGRVALERQGFNVDYYASEIDKHAIEVSDKNGYSVRFGDVRSVKFIPNVDLLIGGSPCQDLSIAKHGRKGLDGDRSGLFWEYLRILRLLKPKWFILENVNSMAKADKDIITREMGVEPIMIDAALVSAQSRKRLFWTNIPVVGLPVDRGIRVKDILEPDAEEDERMTTKDGKAFCLKARYSGATEKHSVETKQSTMVKFTASKGKAKGAVKVGFIGEGEQNGQGGQAHRVYSTDGKTPTLGSSGCGLIQEETKIRKLTPLECERLQGLPDNYTEGVATTHRYKCLGNAFNVDVIAFIVSFIHTADGSAV
jgi:DNA (cytosine-5)-methyltransferase 3A